MHVNPHFYRIHNYGYIRSQINANGSGVNLATPKFTFKTTEAIATGPDAHREYAAECLDLYKKIYSDKNFWIFVSEYCRFTTDISLEFRAQDYTISGLTQIASNIGRVPQYKRDAYDKLIYECSVKTLIDRLTALSPMIGAVQCMEFLKDNCDFIAKDYWESRS